MGGLERHLQSFVARGRRAGAFAWLLASMLLLTGVGRLGLGQEPGGRALTVTVDRPVYYFDETARGEISGPVLPAERLRVDHLDAFGRVIERVELTRGPAATVPFLLRLNQPFTLLHRLIVTGERGARGETRFILGPRANTWDRYHFIWTGAMKAEAPEVLAALRAAGITAAVARTPDEVEACLTQNFRLLLGFGAQSKEPVAGPSFLGGDAQKVAELYAASRDRAILVRVPCLEDVRLRDTWVATLLAESRQYRAYSPLGYSLGGRLWVTDPDQPLDVCFSPGALGAFRDWVAKQYPSLRSMDEEWESSFLDWPAVMPQTVAEVLARERAKGEAGRLSFAPWLVHKRFLDESFAGVVASLGNAVSRQDDSARVGFGGFATGSAYGGYDPSRLPSAAGWLARREAPAGAALIEGFNRKLRTPVPVVTEVTLGPGTAWRLWESLFSGDRGAILVGSGEAPDPAAVEQALTEALPVMSEINAGLGAVLARSGCLLRTEPVALVYSQASLDVSWMLDALAADEGAPAAKQEDSTYTRNFAAWLELLEDVGLRPAIITPAEVGTPEFQDARYRFVILPKTLALADTEGEQLRRYVEQGGFLLADSQCGLFDEHGRERLQPLLDDLFGVKHAGRRAADARGRFTALVSDPAQEQPPPGTLAILGLSLPRAEFQPVEPGLKRSGGALPLVTFGETESLLAREPLAGGASRGASLYLNATLLTYPEARSRGEGEGRRQLLRNLLQLVGLVPAVQVVDGQSGRDVPLVAKRLFRCGGQGYLALLYPWGSQLPASPADLTVELRLLDRPYVYDMRAGEFGARTELANVTLKPYQPVVLALLPYKVEAVTISGRVSGRDLTYDVAVTRREPGPTEDHIIRLELVGPDGQLQPAYGSFLLAPSGRVTAQTRIGLEAPAGEWAIRAVDVVTGLKAEANFNLEKTVGETAPAGGGPPPATP
jgi:hypothetical protein